MVSNYGAYATDKQMELYGLAADPKPIEKFSGTAIPNASIFYEMDTGASYLYDKDNSRWLPQ